MRRTTLAHGWTYKRKANAFLERAGMGAPERAVTLPHDATIADPRDPAGEANVAFHPDAAGVGALDESGDRRESGRGGERRAVPEHAEGVAQLGERVLGRPADRLQGRPRLPGVGVQHP